MGISPDMMANLQNFWPILVMIGIFYFLLYRPQKREQNRRKDLLESLRRGDKVVTIGGIHGKVTSLTDKVTTIEIAENVQITLNKSSIAQKVFDETDETEETAE